MTTPDPRSDEWRAARVLELFERVDPGRRLSGKRSGESVGESFGTGIGRCILLRELGQRGFGTVWLACQRGPVQREAALKVIMLGMETLQVVARFEAELELYQER